MLKIPFTVLLTGSLLLMETAKGMDVPEMLPVDWGGDQFLRQEEVTNWEDDNIPIVDFAELYGKDIHNSGETANQKPPPSYRYLDAILGDHHDTGPHIRIPSKLTNQSNKELEEWQKKRKEEWESYKKATKSKDDPGGKEKYTEVCISYLKKHLTYKVPKEIRDLIRKTDGMINDGKWSLHLMSELLDGKKPLKNRLYLEKKGDQLAYKILGAHNGIIEGTLFLQVETLTPEVLDTLKPVILELFSINVHIEMQNIQEILRVILQNSEIKNILNRIYITNPNLESLIQGGTYLSPTTTLKPYHKSPEELIDENRAQGFVFQDEKELERAKCNLEKFLGNLLRETGILSDVQFLYTNEFLYKVKGFSWEQWKNWASLENTKKSARESIKKSIDTNNELPSLFTPSLSCPLKGRKLYGRTRTTTVQEVIARFDLDECGQYRKEKIYTNIRRMPKGLKIGENIDPFKDFHQVAWMKVLEELKTRVTPLQKAKPEEFPHQLQAIHLKSKFPTNLQIFKEEYLKSYKAYKKLLKIKKNHLVELSKVQVMRTIFGEYETGLPVGLEFLISEIYEEEQRQVAKIHEIDLSRSYLEDQDLTIKIWKNMKKPRWSIQKWEQTIAGSQHEIHLLEGFLTANLSYNRLDGAEVLYQSATLTALDISHSSTCTIDVGRDAFVKSREKNGLRSLFCIQNLRNLKILIASNNDISDLMPLRSCPLLQELDLSHNSIKFIGDELNGLSCLTQLDLSDNQIESLCYFEILSLTSLNISRNKLKGYWRDLFGKLPNLNELDISGNRDLAFGDSLKFMKYPENQKHIIYQDFKDFFPSLINLKLNEVPLLIGGAWDFNNQNLSDESITLSDQTLILNGQKYPLNYCTKLDLRDNKFSGTGIPSSFSSDRITILDIPNNGVINLNFLKGLPALRILNASRNLVADVSPLTSCSSLTNLNLSTNNISEIESLNDLSCLILLNLESNQLQGELGGIKLNQLTKLEILNMKENKGVTLPSLDSNWHEIKLLESDDKTLRLNTKTNQLEAVIENAAPFEVDEENKDWW